jgi:zinc D-Ala-D-Ala carboxypeptidase
MELDNIRLSPHFTLMEMTTTQVRGINNHPGPREVQALRQLCGTLAEPVRRQFGPYFVTSGYRSPAINRVIGGSPNSRHMDGLAFDGAPLNVKVKWKDVMSFLLDPENNLPIDQAIYEYGRWLHIGAALEGAAPRRQGLMIFTGGKFEKWNPNDPRVKR